MIDFMLLAGPRSGTTWCANWLTTDTTMCLHDPLTVYKIPVLEQLTFPGRRKGIACTGSYLYPDWVLGSKARKAILYRDPEEINHAHDALGLRRIDPVKHNKAIARLVDNGVPVWDWDAIFEVRTALDIWNTLLPDLPFDLHRHHQLVGMNVQPQFNRRQFGREAIQELAVKTAEDLLS